MTHFPRTLPALAALALGLTVPAFAIPGVVGEEDSGDGEGHPGSDDDRGPGTDDGTDYTSYIVNGRPANEGEFLEVPYLSIQAPSGGGACTGSLIDPEWVLTAAHCIPDDATAIAVIFGETSGDTGAVYQADSWIVNNQWDHNDVASQGNDVAVIKLAEPATGIPIMGLNNDKVDSSFLETEIRFIGFGKTAASKNDGGTKRVADVDVVDFENDRIFTYDGSQSTCQGDSGGPGIRYTGEAYAQVTITSYGADPCGSGRSGSMRVDAFLGWLRGRSVPFTTKKSAPANFVCSHEVDPEGESTIVLGVVPYTPKCQVTYHEPALLKAARWQWGDGQASEGFDVEHTVTNPGNYSITMCADVLISEDAEDVRTECVTKTGYITACDVPVVSFTAEQVDGLTWQLKNRTDVSTYGCLTNLSWEIYNESGDLVETLKTWEPEVDFPEVGTYRVVLNVGGYAGVTAQELTIEAKRGVSANCSSVGGTAGFGLFGMVLLAAGMRRRRNA